MKKYFFIFLTFLIMIIIFKFSSEDAATSSMRSEKVVHLMEKVLTENISKETYSHLVRNFAHFILYFLLGISLQFSFDDSSKTLGTQLKVLAIVFFYACSDEFHQSFVPGRSLEFKDLLIDITGGLASIIILAFFRKIFKTVSLEIT
ncbi:VanZ family protein [uncultured Ilyobacter sp.]|uniref:VanZ family protein n=1 Tax=uncultured Ilyobacter sp. TaxID=544433 RepID=UPI0029BFBD9A|nr:VanZ family protein [uncultured Ilyobacter sp.]